MNEVASHTEQDSLKLIVRNQFDEWCERNAFQIPESPTELLNEAKLTAAQTTYIWNVIGFLH